MDSHIQPQRGHSSALGGLTPAQFERQCERERRQHVAYSLLKNEDFCLARTLTLNSSGS